MKTHSISGKLTFSQATQHVFLKTGFTMFPRPCRDSGTWLYDMPENTDHSVIIGKPLLSKNECVVLSKLCERYQFHPNLWHIILTWIWHFPHQKRFFRATFLQPQVLAETFYWHTIKQAMKN